MADKDKSVSYRLIKLADDNYVIWRFAFINFAKLDGLEKLFGSGSVTDDIDRKGMALLISSLKDENIMKIVNARNFKEAWKTLEMCYQNKTKYEPQALFRRLATFKIESAVDVNKKLGEMRAIVEQLKNLGEQVSDNNFVGAILEALPLSFKEFVKIWKNSHDQSLDSLIAKVMAEAHEQIVENNEGNNALVSRGRGRGGTYRSRAQDVCRCCGQKGHWLRDCPKKASEQGDKQGQNQNSRGRGYSPRGQYNNVNRNYYDNQQQGNNQYSNQNSNNYRNQSNNQATFGGSFGCPHSNARGRGFYNNFSRGYPNYQPRFNSQGYQPVYRPNYQPRFNQNANVATENQRENVSNVQSATEQSSNSQPDLAFTGKTGPEKMDMYTWVADSGATAHMSPFRDLFDDITVAHEKWVFTADSEGRIPVEGMGRIVTDKGTLINVLYVPKLAQNLFSINAACRNGVSFIGDEEKMIFYVNQQEIFRAIVKNGLPIIEFRPVKNVRASAATLEDWHARFGHLNKESIKYMHNHNIVENLTIITDKTNKCEGCILNKCHRAPHPSRTTPRAITPGNILHIDTAGPYTESLKGAKYMVLCKDEASGYRQIAFVIFKADIADVVKLFVTKAQIETNNPVLKVRTDQGSEFANANLATWLRGKGILVEMSAAYVPQQNGYIERDIRTIKESAKVMINEARMPQNFWAEACNTAAYVMNRVISQSDRESTPYEKWFGRKPDVSNLKIFGELAVVKKPDRIIEGWSEKGYEASFVGYTERHNTFRFYVWDLERVVTSCDCVFLNKWNEERVREAELDDDSFWVVCQGPRQSERRSVDSGRFEDAGEGDTDQNRESVTVDVREVRTGRGVDLMPREEIDKLIRENSDTLVNLDGPTSRVTLRLGDLEFSETTSRWKNKKSGHFISRAHIKAINDMLNRATFARALTANYKIPQTYHEAIESDEKNFWLEAMDEEMKSLVENKVFDVVQESETTKQPVGSRWVFAVKNLPGGEIRYKARVVAKGYAQIYGIDFLETYSPVVQIMSTRLMLSYAARRKLLIRQFDVKTAFLYGQLDETIYMIPPEGYREQSKVWKLKRSLYGLKQSPRMWNIRLNDVLTKLGLKMSKYDHSIFYQLQPIILVIVYVDDGLIFAQHLTDIDRIMSNLKKEFKMRELEVQVYRGLEIDVMSDGVFIHQESYTEKLLREFKMDRANPAEQPLLTLEKDRVEILDSEVPYRKLVGSLAYLADASRPDIAYSVNLLARKLSNPTQNDWLMGKHVLRYLRGTSKLGLFYRNNETSESEGRLIAYSDSDFAGDSGTSKSTTGYIITYNGGVFHWKAQLQRHVSLSSTEAEVIAMCTLSKELAYIYRMMNELSMCETPAVIRYDNQSAGKIVKSEKVTERTRHLRAQEAYIKEQVELKELELEHVSSTDQLADMCTKMLSTRKFVEDRDKMLTNRDIAVGRSKSRSKSVHSLTNLTLICWAAIMFLLTGTMGFEEGGHVITKRSHSIVHGRTVVLRLRVVNESPCSKFKTYDDGFDFHDAAKSKCQEWWIEKYINRWKRIAMIVERNKKIDNTIQSYQGPIETTTTPPNSTEGMAKRQLVGVMEIVEATVITNLLVHVWHWISGQSDTSGLREEFRQKHNASEFALKKALTSIGVLNEEVTQMRGEYSKYYYHLADTSLSITVILSEIDETGNLMDKVEDSVDDGELNVKALSKVLNHTLIAKADPKESHIANVQVDPDDVIHLDIVLILASENSIVLKIEPFDHWVDINTKQPKYVTFMPNQREMIYNASSDCAKIILTDQERVVHEKCPEPNYRDPRLDSWREVPNIPYEQNTQIRTAHDKNYVYCFPGFIFVEEELFDCPTGTLKVPIYKSFMAGDGVNYEASEKYENISIQAKLNAFTIHSKRSSNDTASKISANLRKAFQALDHEKDLREYYEERFEFFSYVSLSLFVTMIVISMWFWRCLCVARNQTQPKQPTVRRQTQSQDQELYQINNPRQR